MYPGTVTQEDFHKTFEMLCKDLPSEEDFTLELQTWGVTTKILPQGRAKTKWFHAEYSLVWGGKSYTLQTTYSVGEQFEDLSGFYVTLAIGG